jgi:hypothetical protein
MISATVVQVRGSFPELPGHGRPADAQLRSLVVERLVQSLYVERSHGLSHRRLISGRGLDVAPLRTLPHGTRARRCPTSNWIVAGGRLGASPLGTPEKPHRLGVAEPVTIRSISLDGLR